MDAKSQQKLVRFVAAKAAGTDVNNVVETANCVAHIYAVVVLLINAGPYSSEASLPTQIPDLPSAFRHIGALSGNEPLAELCKVFLEAISLFERWLMEKIPRGFEELLRNPITLESPPRDDDDEHVQSPLLSGVVEIWFKSPSNLRRLRRLRNGDRSEGPPSPPFDPSHATERVGYYWHSSDSRFPRAVPIPRKVTSLHPSRSSRSFVQQSRFDLQRGRFRIGLCPLLRNCHPVFAIESNSFAIDRRTPFHNPEQLMRHLDAILECAAAQEIHLLVLPELAVPTSVSPDDPAAAIYDVRGHLVRKLRESADHANPSPYPYGVIAGSFHTWRKEDSAPVNESVFVNRVGASMLQHYKRGRFRVTPKQVAAAQGLFSSIPGDLERRTEEILEGIRYGDELQFFDAGIGRLAVLICADVIAADANGYLNVVERLRPDLVFIVAMTPETADFEAVADILATHEIGTIFVNARCVVQSRGESCLAFGNLALFESARNTAPPSRLRWSMAPAHSANGSGAVIDQLQYFEWSRAARGWNNVPVGNEARYGASWLEIGGAKAGLVVDLGLQWPADAES